MDDRPHIADRHPRVLMLGASSRSSGARTARIRAKSCPYRASRMDARWRDIGTHRSAQAKGRYAEVDGSHLRIANVKQGDTMLDRAQAPNDSRKARKK